MGDFRDVIGSGLVQCCCATLPKIPFGWISESSLRQGPESGANDLDVHFRADNSRARLRQPNLGLKEFTLQP
jgi:hypothetical protein